MNTDVLLCYFEGADNQNKPGLVGTLALSTEYETNEARDPAVRCTQIIKISLQSANAQIIDLSLHKVVSTSMC